MPIEKGTIKVVWITKNVDRIYSKMFDSIEPAVKFGDKKKDYLIFRLNRHKNMQEFSWTLLQYGNYKLYKIALRLYQRHKGKRLILEKIFNR